MIVIYAEKPDMGVTIAKALDAGFKRENGYLKVNFNSSEYCVTWGYGHLCELQDAADYNPELKKWSTNSFPFIPEPFKLRLKNNKGVLAQYKIVKDLFFKSEYIINATDADQEGELIFAYLYQYMNCHKYWKRLWLHSTTTAHIREQMQNLLPSKAVENITKAARARSESDWLVGINATVFYTLKHNSLMTLGRVQTPTLSIVVQRELDIRAHKKEKYWIVKGTFLCNEGEYQGKAIDPERYNTLTEAQEVVRDTDARLGVVTSVKIKKEEKKPPLLYNLDTLQKDANKKYGFSAKKTLDLTQKLYEKHLCSYPRTDWRALPTDMESAAKKIVLSLKEYDSYTSKITDFSIGKPYFDVPESSDSHYAIIPTGTAATDISDDEKKIYEMLCESLIRIYYPSGYIEKTTVLTEVNGRKFETKGTKVLDAGWMVINAMPKEELLPDINESETVRAKKVVSQEEETKPPKRFTDATLINYMKTCGKEIEDKELSALIKDTGIGRSSTRAGIIEGLITKQYLSRKDKTIIPTEKGISLIQNLNVDVLKSPELTANWERKIKDIREGKGSYDIFKKEINQFTIDVCSTLGNANIKKYDANRSASESIGNCPLCGGPMRTLDWGYSCSNYKKGCKFSISNTICGKKITESTVSKLLEGKQVALKGFISKAGKKFDAKLCLEENKVSFKFN